jgi:murein DD-endopeptidase MepM/ murein hydrolase activator NlpD
MARKLSPALLIMIASCAAVAPALASSTDNHAAAFGWRGYANTDLQFSEFYGSDHTLMARFMMQYPNTYTGPILSVNGSGSFFVAKGYDQARLQVNIGGTQQTLDLPNPLLAGVWYHLAVVRTGGSYTFYLDGNQICQACAVSAGNSHPNGTLRLARLADGATDNNHESQFYGFVDDVAVFNTALTAGEITAIATAPRLTGSEPNLYAGYTFDSSTPGGGALPAALSRPVNFLTLTPGPQMPGTPAYTAVVSQGRDNAADALLLPPPFQQTTMRLPFPVGEAWQVIQGWDNPSGSHHGPASFAWDFILAGHPQSDTKGKPIYAAGPGTVVETRNDRDSCSGYPASYVMIQQAPSEIGAYLHFIKGSVAVSANQVVSGGDFLANAGDTGNTGCGAYHLHFALHTLPESQAGVLVTFPGAFSNYEVSTDGGSTWQAVARGVPKNGDWVRSLANGIPVCDADGPYVAQCAGSTTSVTLDGTGSSDPDGDLLGFTWTGPFVGGAATGATPIVQFSGTGAFSVDLKVSDGFAADTCSADVTIVDTTRPTVTCAVTVPRLGPPNHELIDVGLTATAVDVCDGSLPVAMTVFSDEDDLAATGAGRFSPDARDIAPGTLRLRAERKGNADGRVYLIVGTAADGSGNVAHDCCTVTVPHAGNSASIASVSAQAAAARGFCLANGGPPAGFFPIGDGPVVGPKQ